MIKRLTVQVSAFACSSAKILHRLGASSCSRAFSHSYPGQSRALIFMPLCSAPSPPSRVLLRVAFVLKGMEQASERSPAVQGLGRGGDRAESSVPQSLRS